MLQTFPKCQWNKSKSMKNGTLKLLIAAEESLILPWYMGFWHRQWVKCYIWAPWPDEGAEISLFLQLEISRDVKNGHVGLGRNRFFGKLWPLISRPLLASQKKNLWCNTWSPWVIPWATSIQNFSFAHYQPDPTLHAPSLKGTLFSRYILWMSDAGWKLLPDRWSIGC